MITWCNYEWESVMEGGRKIHPKNPYMWYSEECVNIDSDGVAHLFIKHDPKDIVYCDENGCKTYHPTMATGLLRSVVPFDYGTFSASIKCPQGYNLWPSFWLSGDESWPPEIDIMEAWSKNNRYFRLLKPQFPYVFLHWNTTSNVHYNNDSMKHNDISSKGISVFKQCKNPTDNFIKYECIWEPDRIQIKANRRVVREVGKEISNMLTRNIKKDASYVMDVIFNLWHEDPSAYKVKMIGEMQIKDFEYIPYKK